MKPSFPNSRRAFFCLEVNRLLCALALALLTPLSLFADGPKVGAPAPPLNLAQVLQAPEGTETTWEKLRGKVVVLEFWGTSCGPCVEAIPHWNELVQQFADKPIVFIAISDENPGVVTSFLKRKPMSGWIGFEGISQSTRDRYNINGIPTTVIVNQDGIVAAVTHPIKLEPNHLQEVLDTGKSSLPVRVDAVDSAEPKDTVRTVDMPPLFQVTVRHSGPRPQGHGFNCWTEPPDGKLGIDATFAQLSFVIERAYRVRPLCVRWPTDMPTAEYDFKIHVPSNDQREMDQLFGTVLRQTFGLSARRTNEERTVYVLTLARTNAPGLQPFYPTNNNFGQVGGGKLVIHKATVAILARSFESLLNTPVIDESGVTNRYSARMEWKLSPAEQVVQRFNPAIWQVLDAPENTNAVAKLTAADKDIIAAIKGTLPEPQLASMDAELRQSIQVAQAELAKPPGRSFYPDPELFRQSVEEQLGLKLTLAKRPLDALIVERIAAPTPSPGQ